MILVENRLNQSPSFFHSLVAIIQVKPGETNQQAWSRHLIRNPEEANAKIKIFNRFYHHQGNE
jgi:hypothetical protein